jgi:hypothetical protein
VGSIRTHLFDHLSREQVVQLREISEAVSSHLLAEREASCTEREASCTEAAADPA